MTNATDKTLSSKLRASLSTAICYLACAAPALAERVEATKVGPTEHPENPVIIGIFSVLNIIAGVAIVSTVVFSVWWFLTRKDDEDEEEGADSAEGKSESAETQSEAQAEANSEAASEAKVEETDAADKKDEVAAEVKDEAESSAEAAVEASESSAEEKGKND
jgi:flagellar biosynthesis component FlhA